MNIKNYTNEVEPEHVLQDAIVEASRYESISGLHIVFSGKLKEDTGRMGERLNYFSLGNYSAILGMLELSKMNVMTSFGCGCDECEEQGGDCE